MAFGRLGVSVASVGMAALLAAIPLAQAASESSSASTGRPRVVFRAGPGPGTVRIVPRPLTPLALVAVTSGDGQEYTVVSSGTDFSDPTVWQRMEAGTLCWAERPTRATRQYRVREAAVPFPAPPAVWAWSLIALIGDAGPRSFGAPATGDVLSTGQRIRSVVVCVEPQFAGAAIPGGGRVQRADDPPLPASPAAATPSTTDPSVVSLPTASPTEDLPVIPPPEVFAKPDSKITICHATSSTSNPYNTQTVAQDSIDNPNGHGTHTGPLFPEPGWGDVIPPFEGYPGMNWPAGSLLLEGGCELAVPPGPIDPPGIDIDPPDPIDPPGIHPPIVVMPPIYLPTPTPTPSVTASASPSPSASATTSPSPSASVSVSPSPSASVSVSASPSASATTSASASPPVAPSPSTTATGASSPQPTPPPSPVPTAARPVVPERGEVAFTLTDGFRTFTVIRSAQFLQALAASRRGPCPAAVNAGRLNLRAC